LFVRDRRIVWIAVALAAVLVWQRDALLHAGPKPDIAPRPERRVLRVWVCESWIGSAAWLEKQCAIFERTNPGVNLRVRRAQPSELTEEGAVLPDLLLFAPGILADPTALLSPLYGELPVRAELAAAGCWQERQWGVPVAMGGYALLVNPEGYPDPEQPALDRQHMAAAAQPAHGKQPARYALQCAGGDALAYPAALLAQGGALRGGWPQGIAALRGGGALPDDFALCTPDKAYADFTGRRTMALLGTQRDIRRFSALVEAGKGFDFRVVPAQQALVAHGLFPVRSDVPGYDAEATPWLHAMAQSLAAEDIWVPNAFAWTGQRSEFLARAGMALTQGDVDLWIDEIW